MILYSCETIFKNISELTSAKSLKSFNTYNDDNKNNNKDDNKGSNEDGNNYKNVYKNNVKLDKNKEQNSQDKDVDYDNTRYKCLFNNTSNNSDSIQKLFI
ncbi:2576_t:CDS:1 [Cetraspora pellucida]|uniref:2576_t:CDS:1 n=1 Tax=Cetraspora pellucida TaxID=1433469 RepID=A0ACA9K5P8_9GLOM|nr:2576_t:CDS:1 [Cetraspora pellucida]